MRLGMKEVSGDLVGGKNWEIVLSDGNLSFFVALFQMAMENDSKCTKLRDIRWKFFDKENT